MLLLKLIAKKIFFFAILQISTTIPSTVRAISKKFHGVDLMLLAFRLKPVSQLLKKTPWFSCLLGGNGAAP